MVGFTGLCFYKRKVVFKNHYVLPDYRKRGIFRKMLDWSMARSLKRGILIAEATCTNASLQEYIRRGFTIVRKYKIATKVRHEDISKSKRI
jgi:GNAT superfamily N-acetyltransferase